MLRILSALFLLAAAAAAADVRPPAVAGGFYPASDAALAKEVGRYLRGPGGGGDVVALLVPHAGLEFTGEAAGKAYRLLAKGSFDSVIIVGTGHRKAVEGAAIYPGGYAAGGMVLPYDAALASALMEASPLITADAQAHAEEHSIEVQVPFLFQRLGKIPLVAMVMNSSDLEVSRAVGAALAQAVKGKRVLLVASSDLSHYPSGALAESVDKTTLAALQTLDPAFFWLTNRLLANRGLPDFKVGYCGEGAVASVLAAAAALGATEARVLARLNSGDVVSERTYNHVVGYAAAAFVKGAGARRDPRRLSTDEKHELLRLARRSLEDSLAGKPVVPGLSPNPKFNLPGAVFVALKDAQGNVRGRAGSAAVEESLLEAVSKYVRLVPLTLAELKEVRIEISLGDEVFAENLLEYQR